MSQPSPWGLLLLSPAPRAGLPAGCGAGSPPFPLLLLWAELLTTVRAVGLALPLWLPGVEDRPGQESSQPRGPWHSPPTGSCQAFLPWQGEWALLGGRARLLAPGCPAAPAPWASVSAGRRWQDLARAVLSGEGGVSGLFLGPPRVATLSRGPGRPSRL